MRLRAALQDCSLALLRRIAEGYGLPLRPELLPGEIADLIAAWLSEPDHLRAALDGLSAAERATLERVASAGGELRAAVLERWLQAGPFAAVPDPAVALLHRGLLFRRFVAVGPERGEQFYLPDEVRAAVPAAPEPVPELPAAATPAAPQRRVLAYDLFCLLSAQRRARQRGQPRPAEAELAPVSDDGRHWRFLRHLAARLLGSEAEAGRRAAALLASPSLPSRALELYLHDEHWDDLSAAGVAETWYSTSTLDQRGTRQYLLDLVRRVGEGRWVRLDDLVAQVKRVAPDLLRADYAAPTAAVADLASGEALAGLDSWERVEAPLVRYVISGPLHWLGVVALGGDPLACSPLPVVDGAARTPTPVVRQPDGVLVVPPEADLGVLWDLEPYLELRARGPESRYALTRASLAEAMVNGGDVQHALRLLREALGGDLPAGLEESVVSWAARAGRLTIAPAVVLRATAHGDLERVLAERRCAPLISERLGPLVALVAAADLPRLLEELRRIGQVPRLDPALRLRGRHGQGVVDSDLLRRCLVGLLTLRELAPDLPLWRDGLEGALAALEETLGPETTADLAAVARRAAAAGAGRGRRRLAGR